MVWTFHPERLRQGRVTIGLIIWLRRGGYVLQTETLEQGAGLDMQERLCHVNLGTC